MATGHQNKSGLIVGSDSAARLDIARKFLISTGERQDAVQDAVIIAASWYAADEALRSAAVAKGATFGLHKFTLDRLASRLAAELLAERGQAQTSSLTLIALVRRAAHFLLAENAFSYFAQIAATPGFPVAAAQTIQQLRMNQVDLERLEQVLPGGRDLARLARRVDSEMSAAGIADRAGIFRAAIESIPSNGWFEQFGRSGYSLLLIDVGVGSILEAGLVAAIACKASSVLAVAPSGDLSSVARLEQVLECEREEARGEEVEADESTSLSRLKSHLFASVSPEPRPLDDSVQITTAPGEARECVEIARQIQAEARRGVPFDRMAVFLRSTEQYRSHLQEAFHRAAIPAYYTRGTTRPDAAGRALLALLLCKVENLSARRFAEYLSLSQVPEPGARRADIRAWTAPQYDLLPFDIPNPPVSPGAEEGSGTPVMGLDAVESSPGAVTASAGTVDDGASRAPWRWERLLVDAAVIGSRDRWERRLAGLRKEIEKRREELDDPQDAHAAALEQQLADLTHLQIYAMPLIDRLAALPERADWGVWLKELRELTVAAVRDNERILETLAELEPMSPIGPAEIDEVLGVLTARLAELDIPPKRNRYGAVFVGPTEAARGMAFDVVFVPGLAEKLFPKKIAEDPILLDEARKSLAAAGLVTQAERLEAEHLLLRLAVGAARKRVYLSYPRIDIEQSRRRVPSLYTLEAFRATEGTLPDLDRLERLAKAGPKIRLGWPAPENPNEALDEAEYDLALLAPLGISLSSWKSGAAVNGPDAASVAGTAHYLLTANPHLARTLRRRARRWLRRWTPEDGLVDPDALAMAALADHQLSARSYSPTGLQHYSACPYQFFLQAVLRLQPREEKVALETIDPLTRGAFFHEAQFKILTELRDRELLPLGPDSVGQAMEIADGIAKEAADEYRDKLFPAIPRVWDDAMNAIRADLREWLRRLAFSTDGWIPHLFELSFGLKDRDRPHEDPASIDDPVEVEGGLRVRGSIDLVERRRDGTLRVTDHKTGRTYAKADVVIGGGQILQPVIYALVCEKMLGKRVESGRLYYCTSAGGYTDRVVEFNDESRASAAKVIGAIDSALKDGFLPAAPDRGTCSRCDYRIACGPDEELRASVQKGKRGIKPADRVKGLLELREMP